MKREKNDIPTAVQLENELKHLRYSESFRKSLKSTVSSLITLAATAVLISMLFLPVLRVTGTSMTPTLSNGELVLGLKNSKIQKGDIIAFYYNNKVLLKRVIGTAGDIVSMDNDGNVYINDELLDEPYLISKDYGECDIEFPYQVPESRLFVMGDHRTVSIDSRSTAVGCIAEEYIIGKIFMRIYPFNKIGTF